MSATYGIAATRAHRLASALLVVAAVLLSAAGAAAQQTLEQALDAAFASDDAGMTALRDAGGTFVGVLGAERLPSGAYLAEVGVSVGGRTLRYPVKLDRGDGRWAVVWQPVVAYASAVAGLARSGMLPVGRNEERWDEVARLPALGIVATKARIVTPFGVVDRPAESSGSEDLTQIPSLITHAQRWVAEALDHDPGPAGFDLVLDGGLSWRDLNMLMFNASAVGLYELWIVTDNEGELHQVPSAAPVDAVTRPDATPAVVAMYPLGDGWGFRISTPTPASDVEAIECAPQMNLCVSSPDAFVEGLETWIEPGESRAMFAAVGQVAIADAIRFMAAFVDYMGLPAHRVLLGYIQ